VRLLEAGTDAERDAAVLAFDLRAAVEDGDEAAVEQLLTDGVDQYVTSSAGVSLLMAAADVGAARVVRLLLKAGLDPTQRDADGRSAVDYARSLPADVPEGLPPRAETPPVLAASAGAAEVAAILDVHIKASSARALERIAEQATAELLRHQALDQEKIAQKYLALPEVEAMLTGDAASVDLNLAAAAAARRENERKEKRAAAQRTSVAASMLPGRDALKGFNVGDLRVAAATNEIGDLLELLEAGVDPNASAEQDKGFGPLHFGCMAGSDDVVTLLLEHGADANAVSLDGSTPLVWAARGNDVASQLDIIRDLLDAGADSQVVVLNGVFAGMAAMDVAAGVGALDAVALLDSDADSRKQARVTRMLRSDSSCIALIY